MRPDGVNGADGNGSLTPRKTPKDLEKVDVNNQLELANFIAGIENDIVGEKDQSGKTIKDGILNQILSDNVVDDSEKTELLDWKKYLSDFGENVRSKLNEFGENWSKLKEDARAKYKEYSKLFTRVRRLKQNIENVLNKYTGSETDADKRKKANEVAGIGDSYDTQARIEENLKQHFTEAEIEAAKQRANGKVTAGSGDQAEQFNSMVKFLMSNYGMSLEEAAAYANKNFSEDI